MSSRPDPTLVAVFHAHHDAAAAVQAALSSILPVAPPARRVLLKPNLIRERHLLREEFKQVITQPEVLGPVVDWVANNYANADLRIADAPQGDADMGVLLERSGVASAAATRSEFHVEDLRLERYVQRRGVPLSRHKLAGDSLGSVRVNLGPLSHFAGLEGRRYYGADYDIDETNRHHTGAVQEYMFSGTALLSDLVVNLPKLKTHKKAGMTGSLKNLVGLNTNKNWLPHHSIGSPRSGGDAFPDKSPLRAAEQAALARLKPVAFRSRWASKMLLAVKPAGERLLGGTQEVVRSGNWYGNDTIWRMILDLNRILMYGRPDGSLAQSPQRATLSVVDAVVAGDGNGPEAPDAVEMGVVIAGSSFAAVDLVCAKLMGFDWRRIPHLAHVFDAHDLPLAPFDYGDIEVVSDREEWCGPLASMPSETVYRLKPAFGWRGHIELEHGR